MKKILPFLLFMIVFLPQMAYGSFWGKTQKKLTISYHTLLCNIDNTVGEEQNCTKPTKNITKNKLHLITSIKSKKGKNFSVSLNLRGHIDLPNLSKKLRIVFSKQSLDQLNNKQIDRQNEDIIQDNKLRIGLKYQIKKRDEMEFFTKFSFKVHTPFGPYQKLGLKKRFIFPKTDFSIYTRGGIYYYFVQSYIAKSVELNFIKPLNSNYTLVQANNWDINSNNHHQKRLTNHIRLHHNFDKSNHLVYWCSYSSATKGKNRYVQDWQAISISYIHHIRKWLYIQTIPRLIQRHENHYKNEFELSVSLGMLIGL